ncbi:MAG: HDOD domain-containing protein [Candidatus Wallbacteria bacterium]|nr:HDOD domain-containing protein [Candidatus Wallbacteria bacterium]
MDLELVAGRIKDLPTLPIVVNKIVTLVENPKASAADLAKIVSMDPALTTKILTVVNSAFYSFPRKISTISHAVMILGFGDVKNIALSISVFNIFKGKKSEALNLPEFWKHSIGVGVAARLLGKRVKYPEAEEAFIAGLLHDVGKIVFQRFFSTEYAKVIQYCQSHRIWIREAEKAILDGTDHNDIGEVVGEKWKLPPRLVRVLKYHHTPLASPEADMLTSLVHAGDVFTRIRKIGDGGDGNFIPQLVKEIWYKLKISPEELNKVYLELDDEMQKAMEFLELAK